MSRAIPFQQRALVRAIIVTIAGGAMAGGAFAQTAAEKKSEQLVTVIVTAQKRATDAQQTPISLTTVSGDEIAEGGIRSSRDLNGFAPNVIINTNGAATEIAIRGITNTNNTEVGNPAVGFHLDGVYLGRPDAAGIAFFDIERMEVLRGPQGTLWGRNSTAGAFNLITNKPKNNFEAAIMLDVGNYSTLRTEAMLNVPVNDVVAVRAAITTDKHDGYIDSRNPAANVDRRTDDSNNVAGRVHVAVKPNKDLNFLLTLDAARIGGAGYGSVPLPLRDDKGYLGRYATASQQPDTDNKYDGVAAEMNWNLSLGTLTYVGAYRTSERDEANYSAGNTARTQLNQSPKQTSHELRLASNGEGALTWVAGVYSYDEKNSTLLTALNVNGVGLPPGFGLGFVQPSVRAESMAAFGQATFAVTPSWRVTAGLRATRDEASRQGKNTLLSPTGAEVRVLTVNDAAVKSSKTNWRLGTDFALNKDTMIYGNAATGYKAGGFFDGTKTAAIDNTYKPENVTSFELGIKSRTNGVLQTNAALFRNGFKDYQASYRGQLPGAPTGTFVTITQNAAKATIQGAEFEARYIVGNSRFDANLALLDAKFDEFNPPNASPRFDNTGKRLIKSPKTSGSLAYQHTFSVAGGNVTARASIFYSDKYFLAPSNSAITTQGSYTRTDLSVGYEPANGKWWTQAYVRNLENANVIAGLGGLTAPNAFLAPPRTIGIRGGYRF
jgi:iron complex outermembrane recepter protein